MFGMGSFKRLECRAVVVNLGHGEPAIRGVLWTRRGPLLVIRNAVIIDPQTGGGVAADGEVVVERAKVSFIQVLTP